MIEALNQELCLAAASQPCWPITNGWVQALAACSWHSLWRAGWPVVRVPVSEARGFPDGCAASIRTCFLCSCLLCNCCAYQYPIWYPTSKHDCGSYREKTWGFQTICCLRADVKRLGVGVGAVVLQWVAEVRPGGWEFYGGGAQWIPERLPLHTRNREKIIFLFLHHSNINWIFPPMAQI